LVASRVTFPVIILFKRLSSTTVESTTQALSMQKRGGGGELYTTSRSTADQRRACSHATVPVRSENPQDRLGHGVNQMTPFGRCQLVAALEPRTHRISEHHADVNEANEVANHHIHTLEEEELHEVAIHRIHILEELQA